KRHQHAVGRTRAAWVDPDDAPELTREMAERADLYHGNKLIRRGRPPSDNPKQALKLRLDADVVEHFRATGPGWQTRINDTLRLAAPPGASTGQAQDRPNPRGRPLPRHRCLRTRRPIFLSRGYGSLPSRRRTSGSNVTISSGIPGDRGPASL